MKDKKELKPGDVLRTPESMDETLEKMGKGINAIRHGMAVLAEEYQNREKDLWKTIRALLPETEGYMATFDYKTYEVKIKYKAD